MAFSGLDIYKLLPKTNCRQCGFSTCLAFAMQLARKAVKIEKCPYVSKESKEILEAQALPPIKLVSLGEGDNKLGIGDESVIFRHEEKFYHPCGIGIIIQDNFSDKEIKERVFKANSLEFERVGQKIKLDLIAIEDKTKTDRFAEAVKIVADNTEIALVLISDRIESLKESLGILKNKKPLIYPVRKDNLEAMAGLAKNYGAVLGICAKDLDDAATLTEELNRQGVSELVLEIDSGSISDKIWDLTQIRRLALKKRFRALGYPTLTIIKDNDPHEQIQEAATYICKYSGIILLEAFEDFQILPLLTLRQNIYSDPQKPLQIEPKMYPIGNVNDKSPVLVTTNFSLSYFTVLGEVEASKVPSYIISVDTEGMSVLTAWAAEKFTPQKITEALATVKVKDSISHNNLIIPGYVAVMSGELEDESGFRVIVGPKEAAGIPSFLKNYK